MHIFETLHHDLWKTQIIPSYHKKPATITPNIINLINTIAKNENMNSILTNNTSFAGVDNYCNEFENEIDDNIDSNTINEILHEPSEFHTPNQNNNISSSNEIFDNTKVTIHKPETHDKTEEENIFEYKNDDLLDNSFNSISGINDLDLPNIDIHPDSMDRIANDDEDIIYNGNTTEYNTDSN